MPEHGQILFIRAGFPFIKVSLIFFFTTEENIQTEVKHPQKQILFKCKIFPMTDMINDGCCLLMRQLINLSLLRLSYL